MLLGGASVISKSVLDTVGGFSPEFFRQAEEYDLSFRILSSGFRIERFEDVEFFHEKVPGGRSSALTHRMDLRNNLILVERFLPRELRRAYRRDWIRRYSAFALHEATLVLATLMRHFTLDLAPGQTVWPVINFTLRPRDGLRMTVKRRRAQPQLHAAE